VHLWQYEVELLFTLNETGIRKVYDSLVKSVNPGREKPPNADYITQHDLQQLVCKDSNL